MCVDGLVKVKHTVQRRSNNTSKSNNTSSVLKCVISAIIIINICSHHFFKGCD